MVKTSIIWITSFAVALISGLTAMGAIAKSKAPELAITLVPANGFAAEKVASYFVKTSIAENSGQFSDDVDRSATEFARNAFIAEPLVPEAIAILALAIGEQDKRKLMGEALLLSRRHPLISAWMIADSGARNDMPALLNHYDTMLRTSTSAGPVIISLMAGTLADANFVAPLASLLEKQPPWAPQFWNVVADTPESIGNAARLREMLYKEDERKDIYRDAAIITGLVRNNHFDQAESLYRLLAGTEETVSLLKNGSFNNDPQYAPLDWQLFSTGEYGAVIRGGRLELSAIRNAGGLFARQLVKLPKRTIALDVNSKTPVIGNAEIFITLTCAQTEGGPQAVRIPLKGTVENLQISNAQSGCSFYWLDISGRTSDKGNGFDISLESIVLR